jgi:hypothetical protein
VPLAFALLKVSQDFFMRVGLAGIDLRKRLARVSSSRCFSSASRF